MPLSVVHPATGALPPTGSELLEHTAGELVSQGLMSSQDAAECIAPCADRFTEMMHRSVNSREAERLRAYFAGVVRRRAMRSRGPALAYLRQRYVLASIARDLAGGGIEPARIKRELTELAGEPVSEQAVRQLVGAY